MRIFRSMKFQNFQSTKIYFNNYSFASSISSHTHFYRVIIDSDWDFPFSYWELISIIQQRFILKFYIFLFLVVLDVGNAIACSPEGGRIFGMRLTEIFLFQIENWHISFTNSSVSHNETTTFLSITEVHVTMILMLLMMVLLWTPLSQDG